MTDRKEIVLAFFRIRVTRNRIILHSIKKAWARPSAFCGYRSDETHQKSAYRWGIKDFMQRDRHLDHPQISHCAPHGD